MRPVAATHAKTARLELSRRRKERVAGNDVGARIAPSGLDWLNEQIAEAPAIDCRDRVVAVDRHARDRDAGGDREICRRPGREHIGHTEGIGAGANVETLNGQHLAVATADLVRGELHGAIEHEETWRSLCPR